MSLFGTDLRRSATISECGLYRYRLDRWWDMHAPSAVWVMLNPSKADAERDDATIRRCISFSKRLKCGSLSVVNLFAFRSTDPEELRVAPDPVGPLNDEHIRAAIFGAKVIVAAWGSHPFARARAAAVSATLARGPLRCLGTTADGSPRHPVRLAGDTKIVPFVPRAVEAAAR